MGARWGRVGQGRVEDVGETGEESPGFLQQCNGSLAWGPIRP